MRRFAEFLRDGAGAVTADWVVLTAGVLMVGSVVIYSMVSGGINSIPPSAGTAVSSVEVGVGADPKETSRGAEAKSGDCSFPAICGIKGIRAF